MPVFDVETKTSRSVWRSPDGQREIFEIGVEYEGNPLSAKTYSKEISVVGWKGQVETYEKQGRNGVETFVKQPPKEDGGYGSRSGSGSSTSSRTDYKPRDDSHIKAQWAIGQAVILLGDKALEDLTAIEALATDLFGMVNRVKANKTLDAVAEVPDKPITIEDIDKVFDGKTEPENLELPWPTK